MQDAASDMGPPALPSRASLSQEKGTVGPSYSPSSSMPRIAPSYLGNNGTGSVYSGLPPPSPHLDDATEHAAAGPSRAGTSTSQSRIQPSYGIETQEEDGVEGADGVDSPMASDAAPKPKKRKSNASLKEGAKAGASKAGAGGKGAGAGGKKAAIAHQDIYAVDDEQLGTTVLPIARVQRIIKADPEMENTSKEAVFMIAAATELFIKHLSDAAYTQARLEKRKVLHYRDVQRAVARDQTLDFLRDIVPASMSLSSALAMRQGKLEEALKIDAGLIDPEEGSAGPRMNGDGELEDDAVESEGAEEDEGEEEEDPAEDDAAAGKGAGKPKMVKRNWRKLAAEEDGSEEDSAEDAGTEQAAANGRGASNDDDAEMQDD